VNLPQKFDHAMRKAIGARSVWLPGTPFVLGSVLVKGGDGFEEIDHVTSFGGNITPKPFQDKSLNLTSAKVTEIIFQGGTKLGSANDIDPTMEASVELKFTRSNEFVLKTPQLNGQAIDKLGQLTAIVAKHPRWDHRKHFIAFEMFSAPDFSFLGTLKKQASITVKGDGGAIISFLNNGVSLGLTRSGSIELDIRGGGPVAMNLARADKQGNPVFL
jgi:hypothetical protein